MNEFSITFFIFDFFQSQQGKQPVLSDDVNLEELAQLTETFTGADLAGLVRQASLQALRESITVDTESDKDIDLTVKKRHFMAALLNLRPSVTAEVKNQFGPISAEFVNDFIFSFLFFRREYNMKSCGRNMRLLINEECAKYSIRINVTHRHIN